MNTILWTNATAEIGLCIQWTGDNLLILQESLTKKQ